MEPTNWTISKLVQKFLDGEIKLPEMQRKYVWKREKVRALVDSIYKGYPSGSILLWETDKVPETRDAAVEGKGDHQLSTTLLLLDGQQRLTSLATVLTGTPIRIRVGSTTKETSIEVYFNMDHPENYQDYDTDDSYEKSSDEYDGTKMKMYLELEPELVVFDQTKNEFEIKKLKQENMIVEQLRDEIEKLKENQARIDQKIIQKLREEEVLPR